MGLSGCTACLTTKGRSTSHYPDPALALESVGLGGAAGQGFIS